MKLSLPIALVALACACGPKELAPRTPPQRAEPTIPAPKTPPPEGSGRLYIDVVDGPALIGQITSIEEIQIEVPRWDTTRVGYAVIPVYAGTEQADAQRRTVKPLCSSPCFIDLPIGDHLIQIRGNRRSDSDVVSLRVTESITAYRHALGRNDKVVPAKALPVALVLGTGIGLTVASPLAYVADFKTAGLVMLGSGALLTILGWQWFQRVRPTKQQGTGSAWQL